MNVPEIPAPRRGRPYESLDKIEVRNHRTGDLIGTVSQVNAGILRKDLRRMAESRVALEIPQDGMVESIGPSLVVTAVTDDAAFRGQHLESPLIERLNLGPIPTMKVAWDQPHEGNMFVFLYKRRFIEMSIPLLS